MNIAIVKSNGMLDRRIERVLVSNKFKGEYISKLTRSTVSQFDYIIFSSDNKIPNLPKVIERIVLEKKAIVLYVSRTLSVGQFYSVINDIHFNVVSESNLDAELKNVIDLSQKYVHYIKSLQHENELLLDRMNVMKLTNKAKRVLMDKGLTEEESHQFIQKKCMDLRIPRKRVVNLIIENKIDI